ncbi:MAG: TIM barrel protein, partial [bacterium]
GTAGVPRSSPDASTVSGLETLSRLNLECLEIEFVRRVSLGEITARKVKEKAQKLGIFLSIHAPYYINLNSHDPTKREASRKRLIDAAKAGSMVGATDIVFHPGFYQGDPPALAFKTIREELQEVLRELQKQGIRVKLRAETTGRHNQFGSLEETLRLAVEVPGIKPCIDFSHLHARRQYHRKKDFLRDLETVRVFLGTNSLEEMHIHLSGMCYSQSGEVNHLNFEESDFPYLYLLEALHESGASGRIICESPNLEEDALLLKSCWQTLQIQS